ncbi:MAG: hypothetical protein K8E24_011845 [Methanobacterium paludis]|uniref:Pentapeptide repeat protein n=1 Tax=Methanobacterium paludis (strain DSM 25820 / JCM 18151 / SWAN1) TaxID=868131 RepID=F6D624_METPW|nr:hypothetical protein [Methanobacterium paludis]AEG17672.1 hypothetical protein MSWAN_0636 [Methanobacterium paludis]MCE7699454.1 hypothetical protein [Methanobacterium paludis]
MVECSYEGCNEEVFEDSDYCILHLELPENENSAEFKRINSLKEKKVQEKIKNKDFNFEGAILYKIKLEDLKASEINFRKAKIIRNVYLEKVDVSYDVIFDNATLNRFTYLKGVTIRKNLSFKDANAFFVSLKDVKIHEDLECEKMEYEFFRFEEKGYIGGSVLFFGMKNVHSICFKGNKELKNKIKIVGDVFLGRKPYGDLEFNFVDICGTLYLDWLTANNVLLNETEINGNIWFSGSELIDIVINDVKIEGKTNFHTSKIKGKLDCKNVNFKIPESQEETFRVAKNCAESLGDKEEADNYFYREMEAKRLQKPVYIKKPEWILQKFFGYGVYPLRIVITFFGIFIVFSLIFWQINGIFLENSIDYLNLQMALKLSFLTLIIPAYGLVSPSAVNYGFYIIIEAIIGAFMWPLFIATFARKYMR